MRITKVNIDQWKAILQSNQFTFFHSLLWHEIYSKYTGQVCIVFQIDYDNDLYYLPVFKRRFKGLFKIHTNGPFGTYGGFISQKKYSIEVEKAILLELSKKLNLDYVGNPYLHSDVQPTGSAYTQIIKLSSLTLATLSDNHKRNIKKAERKNIRVKISESSAEWQQYCEIYKNETQRRGLQASNQYSAHLFNLIYAMPKEHRKLWLIEHENQIIGGAIVFYKKNATYWHGANDNFAKMNGGSHFLQFEIMKHAKTTGFEIYDLNPSGGHQGVIQFKSGFRPTLLGFQYSELRTPFFLFLQKIYIQLKDKLVFCHHV